MCLKEIVFEEFKKLYSDNNMYDYCIKCYSNAIIFDSGMIFVFDKPIIHTGMSKENHLKQYKDFKNFLNTKTDFYAVSSYRGNENIKICEVYDKNTFTKYYSKFNGFKLSNSDIQRLITLVEVEEKKFENRLDKYFKKYN